MASDTSSSTPKTLTPDSTGSPDAFLTSPAKRARRQTAFYPNVNSSNKTEKPFSRSAAKRESVMALGSIEHLQHYFTKTGIAAKKNPLIKPNSGMVPAIGGIAHIKANPSVSSIPEFDLPPSPSIPIINHPKFPSFDKTYDTNPDSLLPGVVDDLHEVVHAWGIDQDPSSTEEQPHNQELLAVNQHSRTVSSNTFDVLGTLKATTRAVRSVRNYVVSLPDESPDGHRGQFRSKSLASSSPVPKRLVSQQSSSSDPLSLIRRSALEVLAILRELEESSRIPLLDDAYDAQSDRGSSQVSRSREPSPGRVSDATGHGQDHDLDHMSGIDPDTSFSFIQVRGRDGSIPVWEDEDDSSDDESEREKKEPWDERLVLGSGWLYKPDLRLENLGKEKEVVERYLSVVDDVLFGGPRDGRRGWDQEKERLRKAKADREGRSKARRVSAGDGDGQTARFAANPTESGRRVVSTSMLDAFKGMAVTEEPEELETLEESDSIDDEELPVWAKRSSFIDDPLSRVHAILTNLLPVDLLPALTSASDRAAFLHCLSSGQLLCVAYNTGVRRSRRPWGYISKDSIHDIVALENAHAAIGVDREKDEKIKTGWTFRRTDNLRLWVTALKLRYLLPIISPPPPMAQSGSGISNDTPMTSPSPSTQRFPTSEPPIFFDARVVARKDDGWETMLETAILKWTTALIYERRGER